MYLGILPQNNGSVVVFNACHVSSGGSHEGGSSDRQRFPLSPQQTCQIHGILPDQVYRLVAHKEIAKMVQSALGEGRPFPLHHVMSVLQPLSYPDFDGKIPSKTMTLFLTSNGSVD